MDCEVKTFPEEAYSQDIESQDIDDYGQHMQNAYQMLLNIIKTDEIVNFEFVMMMLLLMFIARLQWFNLLWLLMKLLTILF